MTASGRKPSSAGEVSSNPWPHQKTMHLDLSRLVGLSLLLRQDSFELIPSRSNNFQSVLGPLGRY